jgi:hypothetical protein
MQGVVLPGLLVALIIGLVAWFAVSLFLGPLFRQLMPQ